VTSVIARFATKQPTVCAVCRRRAMWIGFAPYRRSPIAWLCDDDGCHRAARKAYTMPDVLLDAHELGAAFEAGATAAEYLEEVGTTDLAELSEAQWREFLRRLVVGFEQVLRRKILDNEAPF
jgi:Family of unknown function (DUF6511)